MRMIAGTYRHYKGYDYEAFCLAKNAQNPAEEPFVLYRKLYGDCGFWIRPQAMFFEDVDVDGAFTPRYALIGEPENCKKKIEELREIAGKTSGSLSILHSETMEKYKLVGFDAGEDDTVLIEPLDAQATEKCVTYVAINK